MTKSGNLTVVVTGTSSGIGLETARCLVGHGARVFGSVRKEADGERVRAELGPGFTPLVFDVRDEAAIARGAERVRGELGGETLSGLVNSAGVAIPGPALLQPLPEWREQIDTDLLGPLVVTRAFSPLLGTETGRGGPPGRVVMMSSIAGAIGQPFMSGYVAAKHGLEGLSDTLRRELQLFGIDVIVVGPATVITPIWSKAKPFAGRYAGTPYAAAFDRGVETLTSAGRTHGLDPKRVAETVWTALTANRPRARYAPAQHPLVEQFASRLMPRRALDAVFGLALGLRPGRR